SPSISHNFPMFRSYLVAVRAVDDNAPERSSIATEELVISEGNLAPIARTGGPYRTEIGQGILLNASASSDPNAACGDSIIEYAWDIDGNDSTWEIISSNPQATLPWASISGWTIGQAYPVKLRVTDTFGEAAYAQTTATVYENTPVAVVSANPNPAACNQEVTLTGSNSYQTYPVRAIVMYRWDIDGDGTFDIEGADKGQITVAYPAFDTYTVVLRVEDNNDPMQWDEATVDVMVNLGNRDPQAAISGALQISIGDPLVLSGSGSTDPDIACGDYIASYQWDIDGDGDFDELISGESINLPWEYYEMMVDYPAVPNQISLKVTDSLGRSNIRTRTLYIYENQPVAVFTASPNPAGCNQTITFNAAGSYHKNPTKSIVSYQWDFDGDMQIDAQGVSVTHAYPAFGQYTVTLIVTDNNSPPRTAHDQKVVSISLGNQAPVADPDPDNPNNGYILTYGNDLVLDGSASYDPNENCGDRIKLYEWDIDNNGTFDLTGSIFTVPWAQLISTYNMQYPQVNNTVVLRVTDEFNQTNTESTTVVIYYNEPVAVASAIPTTVACNQTVTFNGTASYHHHIQHSIVLYEWDFNSDGIYDATGPVVTHHYSLVGTTVTATLRVTDDQTFTDTDTVQITISTVNSPPVADAGGPYTAAVGSTVSLTGHGSYDSNVNCGDSIVLWAWDTDGDGLYGAEDTNGANGLPGTDYVGQYIPSYFNPNWEKGLTYTIRLKVTDSHGAVSSPDSTTIYIAADPPPVVQVTSPNTSVCLRGIATVTYTVRDPEGDTVELTTKIGSTQIDYREVNTNDDGSVTTVSFTFDTTAFADAKNYYYVTVYADDGEGGTGQDVSDAAFTIDNTPPTAPVVSVPASGVCYATMPATSASSTDNFTANPTITRVDSHDGCNWTSTFTATDACGNQSSPTVVTYKVSDATLAVTIGGVVEGGIYAPGKIVTYGHTSSSNCVSNISAIMFGEQWGWVEHPFASGDTVSVPGQYMLLVTVTNICGAESVEALSFTINGAPIADAGGPYSGTEGVPVPLSGAGSSDPEGLELSYAWDLDNDGEFDDAFTMETSVQYNVVGTYTVALRVTDSLGAWDVATAQVTIENTAPVVSAGSNQTVNEGDTVTFAGSFTDTGDESFTHTIHWSFGDGSTAEGTLSPTHVYGDNGTYTVTLTVTDDDGAVSSDTLTVVVNNVSPVLEVFPEQLLENEGEPVSFTATYSDAGVLDTHTATIDWGDQSVENRAVSGGTFSGSHIYQSGGVYTVTITVMDDDGGMDTETYELTINGIPIADAGGPYSGTEGVPVPLSGAGSSDPEGLELSYAWDLDNDGEFDDAFTMETSVQYNVVGTYTVALRVTDSLGAWDVATAQVTIENTAPVVSAGSNQTVNEGDTVTFAGSFTDTGDESFTHTIHWSFGDGSTAEGTLSPTHVYGDNGTYTVTLTVTDDDGAVSSDTLTVVVNNVSPVLEVFPEQLLENEGEPVSFTATYSDAGVLDTHTATIDWGDQSVENRAVSGGTFSGSHIYQSGGVYTVTITVMDDDGGMDTETYELTINGIPIADAGGPYSGTEGVPVPLSGAGSYDPEGLELVSYVWDLDND
ncbi:MAG: PKD domain-containing protein, partial [Candidatus Auribacterota bacterium]|nr:PKD domain-containing protein [Candidatus Auribacterota bacterium]